MKILFDQGVPVPLRRFLDTHSVHTAAEQGWETLENGALLSVAESKAFELLVTTDQNLRYQQNLAERSIAVLVLTTTSWPKIQKDVDRILAVIEQMAEQKYQEIDFKK